MTSPAEGPPTTSLLNRPEPRSRPSDPDRSQPALRAGDLKSSSLTNDRAAVGRTLSNSSALSASGRASLVSESPSRQPTVAHYGSHFLRNDASSSVDGTTISPGGSLQTDDEVHDIMNHPTIVLAGDTIRYHAGDRKPLDPYWRPRWEMANFHVAFWTALEQLYIHAPHVVAKDVDAFARYGWAVVHGIETHHSVEEEYYFPALERAISMQTNLEQHASFDDGLRALESYLRSCIEDPSIYSPLTVLSIIDTFALDLATHFADELGTLDPDILRDGFTVADLDRHGQSLQKHVVKDYKRHLYTALPVVIVNIAPGREWPALSPLYRRIVLPMFIGRKHKASWRYGKWPGALTVFGGQTSAPAPSSLAMSPSVRGKSAASSLSLSER